MTSRTRLLATLSFGAIVAIGATACGGPNTTGTPSENTPTPQISDAPTTEAATPTETASVEPTQTPTDAPTTPAPSSTGTAAQAIEAALAAVPGDVVEIDAEDDGTWSVLVRTADAAGTELYIDPVTGEVLREEPESVPSEARDAAPAVTAIDAIDAVLAAAPDAQIRDLDLDTQQGVMTWEVQVQDSRGSVEYSLDATTGDILREELDD